MTSENQNFESASHDSSYGGSTYRLSYDRAENKKNRIRKSMGGRMIVAVILTIVLLFVFAYLALHDYGNAIQKLYASETTSDDGKMAADFQSSVVIVKD